MSFPSAGEVACDDLKERLVALEKLIADPLSDCYIERLLDVVIASVNDARVLPQTKENEYSLAFYKRFAHVAAILQSHRRKPQDFSPIASLGHGAFGRVQLVREVTTGRVCAMKVLKKSRMLTQHTDYWTEREIMSRGDSPWIVQLYHAFQDVTSLYMVMEYVPGGNLVCWMEDVEVISEAACRFYAAETVLALTDLHAMGFIHRDLKPDNLLLDVGGHVKLADFGTAVRVDPDTLLVHCDAAVGTPDYLSPEVLLSQGAGGGSYGFEVDWWALGVLMYEMLYGDTPFYSETLVNTYAKIMSHASHLKFPDGVNVSDMGVDFMKQLLRDRESRLGSGPNGSVCVCNHPWFSSNWAEAQKASGLLDPTDVSLVDWSWTNIRACRAPFQPRLTSETDTSYFQLEPDDGDGSSPSENSSSLTKMVEQEPVIVHNDAHDHSASLKEAECFLKKFPGVQSAFAGFSFSSSYPNQLSLLSGLHVAPHTFSLSLSADNPCSPLVNGITAPDAVESPYHSHPKPDSLSPSTSQPSHRDSAPSAQPDFGVSAALRSQLTRVQSQLDDALLLAELHSSEIVDLTQQLEKSDELRRELESQLVQRETSHRVTLEEAERRAETVHAEASASLARLEAELAEWKAIAQSEQVARESQHRAGDVALALTTAHLSFRTVEVVDRVAGSEMSVFACGSSPSSRSLDTGLQTSIATLSPCHNACFPLSPQGIMQSDRLSAAVTSPLDCVEEMTRRVQLAEASAREAADMLETEQHFCQLYKENLAEKSDQLKELTRELEETRELLNASQNDRRRHYEECEAARRALEEEQHRSRRYREAARAADERSLSASQRAAAARREAAKLRDSLELMKQAYETEKAKCTAAVNKLTEVMSGSSTGALELMYIASAAQSKDTSGTFYLGNAATRHKLSLILGNRQQQQMSNQAREIKRLLNEIKRLNTELAASKRECLSLQASLAEVDRNAHDSSFHRFQHSRENSGDLTLADVHRTAPLPIVQIRSRSGLFGRGKTQLPSTDYGVILNRFSPNANSLADADHEDVFASSSETSNSRATLPRQHSSGEPLALAVSKTETLPRLSLSPNRGDFTLAGVLELGKRQPKRKKLAWSPRVVKITSTHLSIWEYTQDTITILDSDAGNSLAPPQNSASRKNSTSGTVPTAPLEVPLRALYHVRQIDQSDAIHERAEDLATVFNVAYDRFFSDDSLSDDEALSIKLRSTGGQHNSMTLPRKLSFGSSAHFTTAYNPHPPSADHRPQCSGDSVIMKRSGVRSSHGHLNAITLNSPTGSVHSSKAPSISISPHVILVRGHKLHHIRFPRMAVCDLCRKACWQLVSPPPAFQCILCQLKFHATHLDAQDYAIPACGKAIVSLVFRCASKAEREKWIGCLRAAMQRTKMNPLTGNPVTINSPSQHQSSSSDRSHPPDPDNSVTNPTILTSANSPTVIVTGAPTFSDSSAFPVDDALLDSIHSETSGGLSHKSNTRALAEDQMISASNTMESEAMTITDQCIMNGGPLCFTYSGGDESMTYSPAS